MSNQLTNNEKALRLFFTEDVYLVGEDYQTAFAEEIIVLPPVKEFKYLGQNQKKILILVEDFENEVSTDEGKALLRNLLKAINLTTSDFALVNYAQYKQTSFAELKQFFQCQLLIAFGISAIDLKLETAQILNQIVIQNDVKTILTKHLPLLDKDATAKKALWLSLQQI